MKRNYIKSRISSENIEVSLFIFNEKYMVEMKDNDCNKQITLRICPNKEVAEKIYKNFISKF